MAKPARSAPELEALILQTVEQQLGVNAIDGCRVYALAARDNSGANWGVGPVREGTAGLSIAAHVVAKAAADLRAEFDIILDK